MVLQPGLLALPFYEGIAQPCPPLMKRLILKFRPNRLRAVNLVIDSSIARV